MKKLRFLAVLLLVFVAVAAGGYFYFQSQLQVTGAASETPLEIPARLGAREVIHLLHSHGIVADENVAIAYLAISGKRGKLKAGEYLFDHPMTVPEVIERLASGKVYLHRFTVPEGLKIGEIAQAWEQQGFGKAEEFTAAIKTSIDLVPKLEGGTAAAPTPANPLEGFLFPETYMFPAHTTARRAIEAMVARFNEVFGRLKRELAKGPWPLSERETLILASLVEGEAAHDDERPLVASVFLNRLKQKTLLQCDPTVIYALETQNRYSGRLLKADLQVDSPYNTYRYAGLPPGPITNPGARSLEAAMRPATTGYYYFVRTTEGRHTFSETLANHNRAVAAYRAMVRAK